MRYKNLKNLLKKDNLLIENNIRKNKENKNTDPDNQAIILSGNKMIKN